MGYNIKTNLILPHDLEHTSLYPTPSENPDENHIYRGIRTARKA